LADIVAGAVVVGLVVLVRAGALDGLDDVVVPDGVDVTGPHGGSCGFGPGQRSCRSTAEERGDSVTNSGTVAPRIVTIAAHPTNVNVSRLDLAILRSPTT
jgi:hypothetical protein